MKEITKTHQLPRALDRGRPELTGGRRAQWTDFQALIGVRNRAIRLLSRLLLIVAIPLTILALAWALFGPPTLTSLLGTILVVFLFISALGISNNHQNRRPPGR